jgi:hypothetical protein
MQLLHVSQGKMPDSGKKNRMTIPPQTLNLVFAFGLPLDCLGLPGIA